MKIVLYSGLLITFSLYSFEATTGKVDSSRYIGTYNTTSTTNNPVLKPSSDERLKDPTTGNTIRQDQVSATISTTTPTYFGPTGYENTKDNQPSLLPAPGVDAKRTIEPTRGSPMPADQVENSLLGERSTGSEYSRTHVDPYRQAEWDATAASRPTLQTK